MSVLSPLGTWPAWGVSEAQQRWPGDHHWYGWRRESASAKVERCGHYHKSEAAAEKCCAKTLAVQ